MNGTISRHPRADGRLALGYYFLAGVDEAGKRVQYTKSDFDTKREAQDALRDKIAAVESERHAVPLATLPTFAEFFDLWMAEHAARKCSPKTVERYQELGQYAVRHVATDANGNARVSGTMALDAIKPMHLDLMVNALLDHGAPSRKQVPRAGLCPLRLSAISS